MKIIIIGTAGIGYYIAERLLACYAGSKNVSVKVFREEVSSYPFVNQVDEDKITVLKSNYPEQFVEDPEAMTFADLAIYCSYHPDLENLFLRFRRVVSTSTTILPFVIDIEATQKIQKIFPQAHVLKGYFSIFAELNSETSMPLDFSNKFYFGSPEQRMFKKRSRLLSILKKARIYELEYSAVNKLLWKQYFFMSPLCTLTSCMRLNLEDVLGSPKYKSLLIALLYELQEIAKMKTGFSENSLENILQKMEALRPAETSKIKLAFKQKNSEKLWTENIIALGKKLGTCTFTYEKVYNQAI
jgi:ketopantoate reductase